MNFSNVFLWDTMKSIFMGFIGILHQWIYLVNEFLKTIMVYINQKKFQINLLNVDKTWYNLNIFKWQMLQILRYYMINMKNNSRCRLKINLDEILLKSADLFYRYCKKSVEDSFLMVETPLSARALRARLRAGSDVG